MGQSLTRPLPTTTPSPSTSHHRPPNNLLSTHHTSNPSKHRRRHTNPPTWSHSPPNVSSSHDHDISPPPPPPPQLNPWPAQSRRTTARGHSSRAERRSTTPPHAARNARTHRRRRKTRKAEEYEGGHRAGVQHDGAYWLGIDGHPVPGSTSSSRRRRRRRQKRPQKQNKPQTQKNKKKKRGQKSEKENKKPPDKITCAVCMEPRSWHRFPEETPTQHCNHDVEVCRKCLRKWIQSEFESKVWDQIHCPTTTCGRRLARVDVGVFASEETFRLYDKFARKAELEAIPGFRWCTMKGCQSGQVHNKGPKFRCNGCRRSYCLVHKVPWHTMMSCKQYDKSIVRNVKKKQDVASEKKIKQMTKKCPGCKANIEKSWGCDHMTCKCGYEFCWLCRAEYGGAHLRTCPNY